MILGCSGTSVEQACEDYATQQCARIDACTLEGVALGYPDMATCVARRAASCEAAGSSLDSGNSPRATEACAAAIATETCGDWLEGTEIAGCEVQTGARFDGDPCMFNSECDSGFCATAAGASCGECAVVPFPGDGCADRGCGPGLTCTANKVCAEWREIGDDCDADRPCTPRSTCVTPSGATVGTCVDDVATVGATCDPKKHTAAVCSATVGLVCNTTTKTCVALAFVGAGSPCGKTSDGGSASCTGGATCRSNICVADAADGAACDSTNGPSCMSPSRCVTDGFSTSGTCMFPDPGRCEPADSSDSG